MSFIVGFLVGSFVGACAGVIAMCIVAINRCEPPDPEVHP